MRYLLLFLAFPAYAQVDCRMLASCYDPPVRYQHTDPAASMRLEFEAMEQRRRTDSQMRQLRDRQQLQEYWMMLPPKDRPFPYDAR